MTERRVVVTGIGVVSPLGVGYEQFSRGLLAGRHGIRPVTQFDAALAPARVAGEVPDFDDALLPNDPRHNVVLSRAMKLGLVAAGECLRSAGLDRDPALRERTACLMAVSRTEFNLDDFGTAFAKSMVRSTAEASGYAFDRRFFCARGARAAHPMWLLKFIPNLAVAHIVRTFGLGGEANTYTHEAAASAQMLGDAAQCILEGAYDTALCGASDSRLTPLGVARYGSVGLLARGGADGPPPSTPFGRGRSGYVIGEGSAFFLLEELGHARRRGARALAEVAGWGSGSDAYHPYRAHPEGRGLRQAMRGALEAAGAPADAVVATAASLPDLDSAEAAAIRAAVPGSPAVTAPAGALGRTHVAVGAINAAAAVVAIEAQAVPPTANTETPDDDAPEGLVTRAARPTAVRAALANAFSFGGQCASVLLTEVRP